MKNKHTHNDPLKNHTQRNQLILSMYRCTLIALSSGYLLGKPPSKNHYLT